MAIVLSLFVFLLILLPVRSVSANELEINERNIIVAQTSWYGPGFHGKKTASGKRFSQNNPTMFAHQFLPLGSVIKVTNLENGSVIYGSVVDRGPFRKKDDGVVLDVSKAAARKLGFVGEGITSVEIHLLSIPGIPLD